MIAPPIVFTTSTILPDHVWPGRSKEMDDWLGMVRDDWVTFASAQQIEGAKATFAVRFEHLYDPVRTFITITGTVWP